MSLQPPFREYVFATWGLMAAYAGSIAATSSEAVRDLPTPALYGVALLPSLFIAGQMWVTIRLISRVDEFLRAVMAKRFIAAAAVTFAAATTWGFWETIAGAQHLPAWLVYPVFWASFGVVSPFIRSSR